LNNLNYTNWRELKKHAISSTVRLFQTSDLDYNNEYVKFYYKLSLMNAILSRNVGEYILNTLKPDIAVNPHGIYSTHGPAYEILKENGVKSLVWAGANTHTLDVTNCHIMDTPLQLLSSSDFWKEYKDVEVTLEMEKEVRQYFEKRLKGLTADIKSYQLIKEENLYVVNKNDGYKYHVAIFPNVIWDGNITDKHVIFNDYLDWVLTTINYLKNREDIKLYVKSHPSENFMCKESDKVISLIKKYIYIKDIKNLVLIPPETRINTYEFLKSGIDLGIVYDGYLGIEMPYLKIPTIVCVDGGFSSVKGGNFIISDRENYFNNLDNIGELIEKFHSNYEMYYKNLVRYIYWYIFYNIFELPTLKWYYISGVHLIHLKEKDFILNKRLLEIFS